MTYRVEWLPSAIHAFARLDPEVQRRLRPRIDLLAEDPRPPGAKTLTGSLRGHLRIRVGDYRVVYRVENDVLRVLVVRVAHRRDVYRD